MHGINPVIGGNKVDGAFWSDHWWTEGSGGDKFPLHSAIAVQCNQFIAGSKIKCAVSSDSRIAKRTWLSAQITTFQLPSLGAAGIDRV